MTLTIMKSKILLGEFYDFFFGKGPNREDQNVTYIEGQWKFSKTDCSLIYVNWSG